MQRNYKKLIPFLLILILWSCKEKTEPDKAVETGSGDAIIICEGMYGLANSRIDYYSKEHDSISENIFYKSNNRPLGDILQSITVLGDYLYLLVNNSQKIERVRISDFKSEQILNGLQSPRYLLPLGNKAYVSDLYAQKIHIISIPQMQISGHIPLAGWVEEMDSLGNFVYACNYDKPYLYVINSNSDQIVDSIALASNPGSLVKDKNEKLWVLCGGNISQSPTSILYQIDPIQNQVLQSIPLSNPGAFKLRINKERDRIYFLSGSDILSMSIQSTQPNSFISEPGRNWYGLRVEPSTGNIWACDAKSYAENGEIRVYSSQGNLVRQFSSGIIPSDIVFLP